MSDNQDRYINTDGLVDFLEEIKLRTWARKHYTEPERRKADWNPIILQEMKQRDRELTA